MIITTHKQTNWKHFGKYYYKLDNNTTQIQKDKYVLLFNGYLYPDLKMNLDDLFNFFLENKHLKELKKFKGRYSGCFINKQENTILAFNDQLGLNDLFYYYKNSKLIISDKFTDFFKIKIFSAEDLDTAALAEFVLYEHVLMNRTFIKDIKLLPYASIITFNLNGEIQHVKYWFYRYEPAKEFNKNESLDKLHALLTQSILRIKELNPKKEFILGLSGGLDSRLVAKYALDAGISIKPFVFGHKDTDAYNIAKKIAEKLKLRVKELNIKKNYYSLKKEHTTYDPLMNVMYTSYGSIKNALPKADCMLTGFNGDNIFGSHIKKSDFDKNINLIQKIQTRYELKTSSNIMSFEAKKLILKDLSTYTKLKLDDWNICEIFNFENRQLRFIKNSPSFSFYGKFENTNYSIFADIDLVEFALKLPLEELKGSKFYHDFFNKYLPDLANIRPERVPYKLKNNNLVKKIKSLTLKLKLIFLRKTGINLPIYKRITYKSALNWIDLFKQINFNKISPERSLSCFNAHNINSLNDDLTGVRLKFHYLTISNFIEMYIKKINSENHRNPKISVIMATYNDSKFIEQSIKSTLNQTFKDFEFIIINDNSTDNTLDIIKKFQKKNKKIKIINNKTNIGLTKSLNKGLKTAKGKYIARIDGDDWSVPNRFSIQYNYLEQNPDIFMLGSDCKLVFQNHISPSVGRITGVNNLKINLAKRNCMIHSSLMFRNNSSLRYREKFKYTQDYDLVLNVLSRNLNIDNLNKELVYFRINETGVSFTKSAIQQFYVKKAQEFYMQRLKFHKDNYSSFNPAQEINNINTSPNTTNKNHSGIQVLIDSLVYCDKKKALKLLISYKNSLSKTYILKKVLLIILPIRLTKIRRDFLS